MIRPGIRRLFRLPLRGRRIRERELAEEIELHLALRVEQLVGAGWAREEAEAEARRRFGPVEDARRALGRSAGRRAGRLRLREWLSGLRWDGRYALRRMRRNPGSTAAAVLTVALGVGATTAVFGVAEGVLLRPLPYPEAERVVYLWERGAEGGASWVSAPNYVDWRDGLESFQYVAAFTPGGFNAVGTGGPERIRGAEVTPEFFPALGLSFVRGRGFFAEEGQTPVERVAVISHGLWRRQFAGALDVAGQTLELDGEPHVIVGVLSAGLEFPRDADVWVPVELGSAEWKARRGITWLNVIARLGPGRSPVAAGRELDRLGSALAREHPELAAGSGILARPLIEELVGDVRPALLILIGAAAVVLLVVCVNLAGLFLVRASARRTEAAIRLSIGGGAGHLARQSLVETVLVSLLGGALGLLLAHYALDLLQALAPEGFPRIEQASVSGPVLGLGIAVALGAGMAAGLAPALREARADPAEGLRREDPRFTARGRGRQVLVVVQVALAVVLLSGAGHLLQTFRTLRAVDPGFVPDRVLTAWLPLSEVHYDSDEAVERFYRDVLRGLRPVPGVAEAGVVSALPLAGGAINFSFELRDDAGPAADRLERVAGYQSASAGYFEAMGIPVLRGRAFREGEGAGDPPVVIVDETFARRFFRGADPLGREILAVGDRWRRVVGLVGAVRRHSLRGDPDAMFYVPLGQDPRDAMTLVVRTHGRDPSRLAPAVRRAVRDVDPTQPVAALQPLAALVGMQLDQPRFTALVITFFGVATLLLAMLGVYGVVSTATQQRTREIGIRVALGAGPAQVRRSVLRDGLGLTAAGLLLGVAGALPLVRLARSLFHDVAPIHAGIIGLVVLLLVAAASAASWLPAARATAVDPALSLRRE